jgi:hypothetical protein
VIQRFCSEKTLKGRGWDWSSLGSIQQTLQLSFGFFNAININSRTSTRFSSQLL